MQYIPRDMTKCAASPMLGLFWLHMGDIIDHSVPQDQAPVREGFAQVAEHHETEWPMVQMANPALQKLDHNSLARGRVVMDVNTGQYIMKLPEREAKNPILVQRLIRYFGLPRNKVRVENELTYEPPSRLQQQAPKGQWRKREVAADISGDVLKKVGNLLNGGNL